MNVSSDGGTPDNARQTGPALEAMHHFILRLVPAVEKFPPSQKFLLGDANLGLEKLRFLFSLTHERTYLDLRRHEHAARRIDEVGRSVDGWMRAHRGATPA